MRQRRRSWEDTQYTHLNSIESCIYSAMFLICVFVLVVDCSCVLSWGVFKGEGSYQNLQGLSTLSVSLAMMRRSKGACQDCEPELRGDFRSRHSQG